MANLWLDLKGPILADTVYVDGVLAAKDVTIALPPVNLVTADFKAMGTYTAPLPGQIEAMEASITKIGIDLGLRSLVKLTSKTIEIRWAQDVKLSDGSTKTEGCKAFLRCVSKGIPGLNVDPGNASENEIALAVSRYAVCAGLPRRHGRHPEGGHADGHGAGCGHPATTGSARGLVPAASARPRTAATPAAHADRSGYSKTKPEAQAVSQKDGGKVPARRSSLIITTKPRQSQAGGISWTSRSK